MTNVAAEINRFYACRKSVADAIGACERASELGLRIFGAVLSLEVGPSKLEGLLKADRAHVHRIAVEMGKVSLVAIARPQSTHQNLDSVMRALVWQVANRPLLLVVGCQGRDEFDYFTTRLQAYLAPATSHLFIRTAQFFDVLKAVETHPLCERLLIKEYVSRGLMDDSASFKRVETQRRWTADSVDHLFARLNADREWLSSVLFSATADSSRCACRLSRDGSFTCEEGFGVFESIVLPAIQDTATNTRDFFENRDRRSSPTKLARPLRIQYNHDVFSDKRANHRLISVLDGMTNTTLSVLHPNPYVHASLLDYGDGSNYDVWVTTTNSILIVPRTKATLESLQRLCNHICDEFEEGLIIEFQQEQRGL